MKLIKKNKLKNILICLILILIINNLIKYIEGFKEEKIGLNLFDGIVYINLENRTDRKQLISKELIKMNAPENKIHKISGIHIPKNGHKGCIQSHILALQIALMNNWNTTVIIEDDAELLISSNDFNNKIKNAFNDLKQTKWDILMLCTSNKQIDKKISNNFKHIDKLKHATSGICYIINKHYIYKLLELFKYCNNMMKNDKWGENNDFEPYALDQKWNELIKNDNWYSIKGNNIIYQKNTKSSINSRE